MDLLCSLVYSTLCKIVEASGVRVTDHVKKVLCRDGPIWTVGVFLTLRLLACCCIMQHYSSTNQALIHHSRPVAWARPTLRLSIEHIKRSTRHGRHESHGTTQMQHPSVVKKNCPNKHCKPVRKHPKFTSVFAIFFSKQVCARNLLF